MTAALVETKLFLPRARPGLVPRPRLDRTLEPGHARLTLVSAPAGFGKTTLLTTWLSGEPSVAWVSLDEGDARPDVFWSYVLTALERVAPGTGAAGLALLGAGQPVEAVLAAVLNELSVLPDDVTLVLDDYHLAEGPDTQPGLAFLVEHLPPQVRLVISTRADPALPLARLRARGELAEVRAADLRFTGEETSAYLAEATGLALDASDVSALEARTEGWIASLQLAALSLRGRDDPSRFIAGFAGDDRYVVDYLVEEVLDRQPPELRDFLLGTAVLDRLTGPLCDAVTERSGGSQILESLDRRNLFVVPLDDQRRWYRYHHLFGDVLRAHLLAEQPDRAPGLHRRASDWYAEVGEPDPAVRHALAAGDAERAAELAERAIPALAQARREAVFRAWADELPEEVLRNRPVLAIGLVGGRMSSNELDGVEERLQDIERQLALPADQLVVQDPDELARVPASIAMYRSALALGSGDPVTAISVADRALELATDDDLLVRAAAPALSGLASWAMGDLAAAHRSYGVAIAGLLRAGRVVDVLGCSLALADMELALGRLAASQRTLEDALALAEQHPGGPGPLRGTADMLVALSRSAWHRDDLATSADLLRRAEELGEPAGLPQHPYRWRVALARLRAAAGDLATALELLDEAERVYVGDFSPPVHPIHATRARVLVGSGDVAGGLEWARLHGVRADDEPSYLREYEHVTLARVLLAQQPGSDEAVAMLERLRVAAEEGGRDGSLIEILALLAVARQEPASLERALALAEPDGWVRVLLGAGPALVPLLQRLLRDRPDHAFARRVLDAAMGGSSAPATAPAAGQPLVDPLSERELEVLRLLASDLDGPDIARHLVVSLNTVRTHTKHIYAKLGVNSRRGAVSRAHQLGLLVRPA
ncbi:LuxR C-terminal-related transcriptional regulator [Nocardioides halotolerans]|uniref:LuxR C-terminal-related transcriptional regulator n=1 Tax=Nocardioides halotolerans TaxID=433660 RepID=UPI0003FC4B29|nr:LuxR C-terminal-related transcriptional regulator [Nocardioides halotolerans]